MNREDFEKLVKYVVRGGTACFQQLGPEEYAHLLQALQERTTGLTLIDDETFNIKRSGLNVYMMHSIIKQIEVRTDSLIIGIGDRPFCNISLALRRIAQ